MVDTDEYGAQFLADHQEAVPWLRPDERPASLTVAELIAQLSEMPPDLPVSGEGCDCINPVTSVEMLPADGVLDRSDRALIVANGRPTE